MAVTTKRELLDEYIKYLRRQLTEVTEERDKLEGSGPEYAEDDLHEAVQSKLSMYHHEYDEGDLYDLVGNDLVRAMASDDIDEWRKEGFDDHGN